MIQNIRSDRQSAWKTIDGGSDIVQEAVFMIIPKKKECKKAKYLSEEALQIPERIREAKSKREKERYYLLNAEIQEEIRKPSSVINAKK